ncbi:MAG TPA: triose-phosphate isomerase [Gammaproteobacteria bacterium]|nr:triose-phosphate isomerase [Gammaproteobacteria bacterium]HRP87617.1 triose-phosphate isomerase [Gammaproteobacteria bacterium]
MRQKLVAGNWKMYGSRAFTRSLVAGLAAEFANGAPCEIAVCPPFAYLADAVAAAASGPILVGGQDVSAQDEGAFTGEVSGSMLADLGCRFAIVGHSERRSLHGESDELVAGKFLAAQRHGLVPILCVGESLEEREAGQTEAVVGRQLGAVVGAAGIEAFSGAVIAYEPIWAIGTGRTASPEQAQAVHTFIRGLLRAENGTIADFVKVLYGGSVKAANAAELFAMPDVDGGLVGGASLEVAGFASICRSAG